MIPVRFHPGARTEFTRAATFYEERRPGTGTEFTSSVQGVLRLLSTHLQAGTPVPSKKGFDIRQFRVTRFPYFVVYRVIADRLEIFVLAVAHARRKAQYWASRAR